MATDTRARMIATTARLLQHRGYHGTSLNDILSACGAPRGSMYFHFPGGKEQLAIEATRASVEEATEALRRALEVADGPAQAVRLFIEEAAQILQDTDYTFGCPVAPVILDASGGVSELEALCRAAFEEWVGLLRDAFIAMGIQRHRASSLAMLVESSIEGLLLIARAYRDTAPLMTVAKELETVIAAATPAPRKRTRHPKDRRGRV